MNYKIIGKYIKDLEFSIPSPRTFFLLSKSISNYKINLDIKSNQIKPNILEVLTTLSLIPIKDEMEKIKTKIVFSTIIELLNKEADKKNIEKIVLINVPSEIYSDLRKVFINLFENSGFNDVKINENVEFEKLYKMKKSQ